MTTSLVYLIACQSPAMTYVKVGRTRGLRRRLFNIQTGCPHWISHVFAILSRYEEEVAGLEGLLHRLLKPSRLRGEWYEGTRSFFAALDHALSWINGGGFTFGDIDSLADAVGESELEIMLHGHDFQFRQVPLPLPPWRPILCASVEVQPARIADILARG